MSIIHCIEKKYSKFKKEVCWEKGMGYGFKIGRLDKYIILSFQDDKSRKKLKKCDCIIFTEDFGLFIGIVELKSYIYEMNDVRPQLLAGLKSVYEILDVCQADVAPQFIAIAVVKKGIDSSTSVLLQSKKNKLKYQGLECNILIRKFKQSTFQEILNIYR